MLRGEGTEVVEGVTPEEVFAFVLDPAQYTKADTKILWIDKLADIEDGMIALEHGKFFGFKGSIVTRNRWAPDRSRIDITLLHGLLGGFHGWFEMTPEDGGTRVTHVEEITMPFGPAGRVLELVWGRTFADSVRQEVREIKRLMEAGERGKGPR